MAALHSEAMKKNPKKSQKANKIFDVNHTEKKPDFANLASKKPNWQLYLVITKKASDLLYYLYLVEASNNDFFYLKHKMEKT